VEAMPEPSSNTLHSRGITRRAVVRSAVGEAGGQCARVAVVEDGSPDADHDAHESLTHTVIPRPGHIIVIPASSATRAPAQ